MTRYGWDLSNHDWGRHWVDLADAKAAGIDLVTHKATEGDWYRDPHLTDFAKQLRGVSFPVEGTYHVLNHGIDVNTQTDYWIATVEAQWPEWRKHPCAIWQIDAEPLDGYKTPTLAEILACGHRLESRLGIHPSQIAVYGPRWAYGDTLNGLPYHLWASAYVNGSGGFKGLDPGDNDYRWSPYSGKAPTLVQYTSSATIGKQRTCDANAIRVATVADLQALFVPHPAQPAQPKEFTMDAVSKKEIQAMLDAQSTHILASVGHAVWSFAGAIWNKSKPSAWTVLSNLHQTTHADLDTDTVDLAVDKKAAAPAAAPQA